MSEPAIPIIINRTPIQWVPELPGDVDWSNLRLGHSPLCGCEECRLKEQTRLGSRDSPLVVKAPGTLPS